MVRRGGTGYPRTAVKGAGELPHEYFKMNSGSLKEQKRSHSAAQADTCTHRPPACRDDKHKSPCLAHYFYVSSSFCFNKKLNIN